MNKFSKVIALVVIGLFVLASSAIAATNIYKDRYTTEDSTGDWTFSQDVTVTGNLYAKTANASIISNTPATITTANSGKLYIIDGGSGIAGATHATIVSVTLPPAAAGLYYRFMSGDGSGIVVRPSDSNYTALYSDLFLWGNEDVSTYPATGNQIRLTRNTKGATGTVISVYGGSNGKWYVNTTQATSTSIAQETRTVDPKAPAGV